MMGLTTVDILQRVKESESAFDVSHPTGTYIPSPSIGGVDSMPYNCCDECNFFFVKKHFQDLLNDSRHTKFFRAKLLPKKVIT